MISKEQTFPISLLDLAVILYHVHRGTQMPDEVGYEDLDQTLQQLTKDLSPLRARVKTAAIESGLWSCNLMDEAGEFWSPTGEDFDAFLARVMRYASPTQKLEFDKRFNLLSKTK